jgi:exonuclease III
VSPKKSQSAADSANGSVTEQTVKQQFARSPFLVAFQSGWFRFSLCAVHIYYGKAYEPQLQRRIAEIQSLVQFFADRQDKTSKQEKDRHGRVENDILLGDFNIVSPEHKTMKALKHRGFNVPAVIDGNKIRTEDDHYYYQIDVRVKDPRFRVVGGGLINLYPDVFRKADLAIYDQRMPKTDPERRGAKATTRAALYKKWRTWQMSDHAPLWIEIAADFSDGYLRDLIDA